MKAIIRKTGEKIDLISYSAPLGTTRSPKDSVSYIDSNGTEYHDVRLNFYWDIMEDPDDPSRLFDINDDYWTDTKVAAAINIMASLVRSDPMSSLQESDLVKTSVQLAKELVEELKKG
jgi:hypothetical protein